MLRALLIICVMMLDGVSISRADDVVAVVCGNAITAYEVEQRAKIFALFRGYDMKNPEIMQELKGAMIGMLIDEGIRMDFVKKSQATINDSIADNVMIDFANRQGYKDIDGLKKAMRKYGIDYSMMRQSVINEFMWMGILSNGVAPSIKLNEAEVISRAKAKGIVLEDQVGMNDFKNQLLEEKVGLMVRKLMSQMKRYCWIEVIM